MSEEQQKKCPVCGAYININAVKCRFCGNFFSETKKCPFCGETVKSDAIKCRYCGEMLNDISELRAKRKKRKAKARFVLFVILCSAAAFVYYFYFNIPSCSDPVVLNGVNKNITDNFQGIRPPVFDKNSVKTLSRMKNGSKCTINAKVSEDSVLFEYTYTKTGFNEFEFMTKPVLDGCSTEKTRAALSELITKNDIPVFKNITGSAGTRRENEESFDENKNEYLCSAEAKLTAKPGRAFQLKNTKLEDADKDVYCKIDYKNKLCKNGLSSCSEIIKIYDCKYPEDSEQ